MGMIVVGVRVPGPVKKRKKEELCWLRQVL